jgi:hypothetical protein
MARSRNARDETASTCNCGNIFDEDDAGVVRIRVESR